MILEIYADITVSLTSSAAAPTAIFDSSSSIDLFVFTSASPSVVYESSGSSSIAITTNSLLGYLFDVDGDSTLVVTSNGSMGYLLYANGDSNLTVTTTATPVLLLDIISSISGIVLATARPSGRFANGCDVLPYIRKEWCIERVYRLFDGLRGLNSSDIVSAAIDFSNLSFVSDHSSETRHGMQYKIINDIQRKMYTSVPMVTGNIKGPFDLPGWIPSEPKLWMKLRTTINGITTSPISVRFDPIGDGTNTTPDEIATTISAAFQSISIRGFVSSDGRVSIKLDSDLLDGASQSIEVMSIPNDIYSLIGWNIGTYYGTDGETNQEFCNTTVGLVTSVLKTWENVKTTSLGY